MITTNTNAKKKKKSAATRVVLKKHDRKREREKRNEENWVQNAVSGTPKDLYRERLAWLARTTSGKVHACMCVG